jgi:hypothetical protein
MHRDALPQGAPTSPAISNIIMKDFDNTVGQWCDAHQIAFTRYCDDMTFSGSFDPKEVVKCVEFELKEYDYKQTIFEKDQDKISFALEQLEKVKEFVKENESWEIEGSDYSIVYADDVLDQIDNQIEELKKENR